MTESNAAQLAVSAHESYLSDSEVDALIRIAQAVPARIEVFTVTDKDGVEQEGERTIYGTTPEADDALEQLTKAFLPLIHKVAKTSRVLDPEEALMTCLEELISAVRRYELGSALPFKAGLRTVLLRKVGDVGRTSGLIVVKENAAARYRQIMDRHDWDLQAAYEECKTSTNGFDPDTFLKVHNSLGVDSLDVTAADDNHSINSGSTSSGIADQSQHRSFLADPDPSPEDITVQAETVAYLFRQVTPQEQQIVRLAYGFSDIATENARMAAGFRADGSPMPDREVAQVLGMRTPTVNRHRNHALDTMRAALVDEDDVTPAV